MPKVALDANRYRIWAFGKEYCFQIPTLDFALKPGNKAVKTTDYQKRNIFLHCTGGNRSAEQTTRNWFNSKSNSTPVASQFILEQAHEGQVARNPFKDTISDSPNYADAVRLCAETKSVNHAETFNPTGIGIEINNIATNWYKVHPHISTQEPTFQAVHEGKKCPNKKKYDKQKCCPHGRPQDENRYYKMETPAPKGKGPETGYPGEFQAFDEEQYNTLTLLLRYLCINHRIPRRFFGYDAADAVHECRKFPRDKKKDSADTKKEKKAKRDESISRVFHFSGILFHRNVSLKGKACPGPIHRNRIFRSIIDEWWLPVEFGKEPRPYYSGPFKLPAWAEKKQKNMYFKPTAGGKIEGCTFLKADFDYIMGIKSFINIDKLEEYYQSCETEDGGIFPIGINKIWHGGIHMRVEKENPFVYAASSGTIVAARVSSNSDAEKSEDYGSQRFVLIKHAVYAETEDDPNVDGGKRIRYSLDGSVKPKYFYSLYMHLAPFEGKSEEEKQNPGIDENNPPWFNIWRESKPDEDIGLIESGEGDDKITKGKVFCPNIEVSVGDIIGRAGDVRGETGIHFEIMSPDELTETPWDDAKLRGHDPSDDILCNNDNLNSFLKDAKGDGIDNIDVLEAAKDLRNAKTYHMSEWAITKKAQIEPVITNKSQLDNIWKNWQTFTFIKEAIDVCPELKDHLGEKGIYWHYHPITFMDHINKLIQSENREVPEELDKDTNVAINDDGYIAAFIQWNASAGAFEPKNADSSPIKSQKIVVSKKAKATNHNFKFELKDIACKYCVDRVAGDSNNPVNTMFAMILLELVERVRRYFDNKIDVEKSYVCPVCAGSQGNSACNSNTADGLNEHQNGLAIDFKPSKLNPQQCRALWNSVNYVVTLHNDQVNNIAGSPSYAANPPGYGGLKFSAYPEAAQTKLSSPTQVALTAGTDEVNKFSIHLALAESETICDNSKSTPLPVTLRIIFEKLFIIKDLDAGKGEWDLNVLINDKLHKNFKAEVSSGDVIDLKDWTKEITLVDAENLRIVVDGKEDDPFFDDKLGVSSNIWNQKSTPAWGIGGSHKMVSARGTYELYYKIESVNTDFEGM